MRRRKPKALMRITSAAMAVVLAIGLMPLPAFAGDGGGYPLTAGLRSQDVRTGTCGTNVVWSWDGGDTVRFSRAPGAEEGAAAVTAGIDYWFDAQGNALDRESDTLLLALQSAESHYTFVVEDGVTALGDSFMTGCKGVASLRVPATVTSLADQACSLSVPSLEVHFAGADAPALGDSVFFGKYRDPATGQRLDTVFKFYVPEGATSYGNGSNPASGWDAYPPGETFVYEFEGGSAEPIATGTCGTNVVWSWDGGDTVRFSRAPGAEEGAAAVTAGIDYWFDAQGNALDRESDTLLLALQSAESHYTFVVEDGVTALGDSFMTGCKGVASLRVPATVTSLADQACSLSVPSLEVHFAGADAPALGDSVFFGKYRDPATGQRLDTVFKFYVPEGATSYGNGSNPASGWDAYPPGETFVYEFEGDEPAPVTTIPIPNAISGLVYTGENLIGVPECDGYRLSGDISATNAGTYTVTAILNEGYAWDGGSTDPVTITWTIARAQIDIPQGVSHIYSGDPQVGLTVAEGDLYTVTGDVEGTDPGDYTATVTVKEEYATNYEFTTGNTSAQVEWSIIAPLSGSCGGDGSVTWSVEAGDVLHISGTGGMLGWRSWTVPFEDSIISVTNGGVDSKVYSAVTTIVVEEGITDLAPFAFMNKMGNGFMFPNVTEILLPEGLVTIGHFAFGKATSLQTINIPSTVTALGIGVFNSCSNLESIYSAVRKAPTLGGSAPGNLGAGALYGLTGSDANTWLKENVNSDWEGGPSRFYYGSENPGDYFCGANSSGFVSGTACPAGSLSSELKVYVPEGAEGYVATDDATAVDGWAQYADNIEGDAAMTLAAAKAAAKAELEAYKNANDYRVDQQTELAAAIAAGKAAIDAAGTSDAVTAALNDAKAAIDQIKTDAQLTEEEAAAKSKLDEAILAAKAIDTTALSAEQKAALEAAITTAETAAGDATATAESLGNALAALELPVAKAEAAVAKAEADAAKAEADAAKAEADAAKAEADAAKETAERKSAEAETAKQEAAKAEAEKEDAIAGKADADKKAADAAKAQADAEKAAADAGTAKAEAEKAQKAAEQKATAAESAKKSAEQKATAAEKAQKAAEKKATAAAKAQKSAKKKAAAASKAKKAAEKKAAKAIKANTMKVKAKKLTASAKKAKSFKKAKAFKVTKAKGKLTFAKLSGNAKITVTAKGKVKVAKGLKAGKTYKVKVLVAAKGGKVKGTTYAPAFKQVTLKVKVAKK